MVKNITILFLFICSLAMAQATPYEEGMQKALGLWKEGKLNEASALFERLSTVEKKNWLPNYYVALLATIQAFNTKDKERLSALLSKAQSAQDQAIKIEANNPELLVLQAMIYTAWIVSDPQTNAMRLSGKIIELYAKADFIAPKNPRVIYNKAEFEIGMASFFGQNTKPMCAQIEKAIELFATFKQESPFYPDWGLNRAEEALKKCK